MAEVSEKDMQEPAEGEATAAATSETNLVEETDPWALADPDLSNIKPWKGERYIHVILLHLKPAYGNSHCML